MENITLFEHEGFLFRWLIINMVWTNAQLEICLYFDDYSELPIIAEFVFIRNNSSSDFWMSLLIIIHFIERYQAYHDLSWSPFDLAIFLIWPVTEPWADRFKVYTVFSVRWNTLKLPFSKWLRSSCAKFRFYFRQLTGVQTDSVPPEFDV